MTLTNEELQDIISNLSPEERKQLISQLGRQVEVDNITNPTQSTNTNSLFGIVCLNEKHV